jgi:Trypsin-co-occurring domain 1
MARSVCSLTSGSNRYFKALKWYFWALAWKGLMSADPGRARGQIPSSRAANGRLVQLAFVSVAVRDMNNSGDAMRVVTAKLPSGIPVQVEVSGPESGDGLTSVGLGDLNFNTALDAIGEIGSAVVEKLKAAKPSRAVVELRLGFAVEAGKITALWMGGRGDASLTVTLEWSGHSEPSGSGDG